MVRVRNEDTALKDMVRVAAGGPKGILTDSRAPLVTGSVGVSPSPAFVGASDLQSTGRGMEKERLRRCEWW